MPANRKPMSNPRRSGPCPRYHVAKSGHAALRKGRVSLPSHVYLVTTTTLNRQPVFDNFRYACVAARCFEDRALLGDVTMLAWVLMPDHAHWLLQLGEHDDLSMVVNRLKSASARQVNRLSKRSGAFWDRTFHDHALRSEENLREAARYVIVNPVRAGLVERIEDYSFWNAYWL